MPRSVWSVMRLSASAPTTTSFATGLDEAGSVVERVEEAGAGGVEVDGAGEVAADLLGDRGREARRHAVRRQAADHDAIDVGRVAARVGQGHRAGLGREVGERARPVEVAALADPVRRTIPLVGRVEVRVRSAFVTISSGSAAPMPKMPAFTRPPAACA